MNFRFDWKRPDYGPVLNDRIARVRWLRANPDKVGSLLAHYRESPADMIHDWGMTYDPRNLERGLPGAVPFLLFPKQRAWIEWVMDRWRNGERGLTDKSRDMGVSWLACGLAAAMCITRPGFTAGFGSRDQDTLDKSDDPSSLFWKLRFFVENLPLEFRAGYTRKSSAFMRVSFPGVGSQITGDAGDNIGRGGRTSIYFVDEAAHLKRPMAVEAALSATTNCRIDISSVNGMGTPFAQRRHSGKTPVMTLHWRDDPRKDDRWYEKICSELDPVTVAQEIDINYAASVTGVLIPSAWINAAVDSDRKLGVKFTGGRMAALDVADEGVDLNSLASRLGMRLDSLTEWHGKGSDIFDTVLRAFALCDDLECGHLRYDADGLGAGVRGDARVLNDQRKAQRGRRLINVTAFRGSGAVSAPEKFIPSAHPGEIRSMESGRKNKDYFANAKAQEWWELRTRFQRTYRAVEQGGLGGYQVDDLICIDSKLPLLTKLTMELSQPTYSLNIAGKILVDKAPDGHKSPNLADSVMICYARNSKVGYTLEDMRRAFG